MIFSPQLCVCLSPKIQIKYNKYPQSKICCKFQLTYILNRLGAIRKQRGAVSRYIIGTLMWSLIFFFFNLFWSNLLYIHLWTQWYKRCISQGKLTAFVVDNTFLSLLSLKLTERTVLRILFDVSLSGPHPHPTGNTASRPADPLRHHACWRLCRPG